MKPGLVRRLFIVPIADNDHGKSRIMTRLLSQGTRRAYDKGQMGARTLLTPWGREVDAYLFVRSYQETLKSEYESVKAALDACEPNWRTKELIFLPSHTKQTQDISEIISTAHSAGFDTVAVSILFDPSEAARHEEAWALPWDERWTLNNPSCHEDWKGQVDALAHDLWTWVSAAITRQ